MVVLITGVTVVVAADLESIRRNRHGHGRRLCSRLKYFCHATLCSIESNDKLREGIYLPHATDARSVIKYDLCIHSII